MFGKISCVYLLHTAPLPDTSPHTQTVPGDSLYTYFIQRLYQTRPHKQCQVILSILTSYSAFTRHVPTYTNSVRWFSLYLLHTTPLPDTSPQTHTVPGDSLYTYFIQRLYQTRPHKQCQVILSTLTSYSAFKQCQVILSTLTSYSAFARHFPTNTNSARWFSLHLLHTTPLPDTSQQTQTVPGDSLYTYFIQRLCQTRHHKLKQCQVILSTLTSYSLYQTLPNKLKQCQVILSTLTSYSAFTRHVPTNQTVPGDSLYLLHTAQTSPQTVPGDSLYTYFIQHAFVQTYNAFTRQTQTVPGDSLYTYFIQRLYQTLPNKLKQCQVILSTLTSYNAFARHFPTNFKQCQVILSTLTSLPNKFKQCQVILRHLLHTVPLPQTQTVPGDSLYTYFIQCLCQTLPNKLKQCQVILSTLTSYNSFARHFPTNSNSARWFSLTLTSYKAFARHFPTNSNSARWFSILTSYKAFARHFPTNSNSARWFSLYLLHTTPLPDTSQQTQTVPGDSLYTYFIQSLCQTRPRQTQTVPGDSLYTYFIQRLYQTRPHTYFIQSLCQTLPNKQCQVILSILTSYKAFARHFPTNSNSARWFSIHLLHTTPLPDTSQQTQTVPGDSLYTYFIQRLYQTRPHKHKQCQVILSILTSYRHAFARHFPTKPLPDIQTVPGDSLYTYFIQRLCQTLPNKFKQCQVILSTLTSYNAFARHFPTNSNSARWFSLHLLHTAPLPDTSQQIQTVPGDSLHLLHTAPLPDTSQQIQSVPGDSLYTYFIQRLCQTLPNKLKQCQVILSTLTSYSAFARHFPTNSNSARWFSLHLLHTNSAFARHFPTNSNSARWFSLHLLHTAPLPDTSQQIQTVPGDSLYTYFIQRLCQTLPNKFKQCQVILSTLTSYNPFARHFPTNSNSARWFSLHLLHTTPLPDTSQQIQTVPGDSLYTYFIQRLCQTLSDKLKQCQVILSTLTSYSAFARHFPTNSNSARWFSLHLLHTTPLPDTSQQIQTVPGDSLYTYFIQRLCQTLSDKFKQCQVILLYIGCRGGV